MLEKLADTWVNFMIKNGAPESEREIYMYGLICTLNELFGDVILLICALLIHRVWEMLVWILVFDIIRSNVGGYHAKSPLLCLTMGTLVGMFSVLVYPIFNNNFLLIALCILVCLTIIYKVAPVTNVNHPVSERKKQASKKRAVNFSFLFSSIILILHSRMPSLSSVILMGLLSASLMSLIGYIKNRIH